MSQNFETGCPKWELQNGQSDIQCYVLLYSGDITMPSDNSQRDIFMMFDFQGFG